MHVSCQRLPVSSPPERPALACQISNPAPVSRSHLQYSDASYGVGAIDPHADLPDDLLNHIPPRCAEYLVYSNLGTWISMSAST